MITLTVDYELSAAEQIRDIMRGIDPEGKHYTGTDLTEMLAFIKENRPDVVCLGIEPTAAHTVKVAKTVMQAAPSTNIIFVSEHSKCALDAFKIHASGYLIKPVSEEALREEILNLRYPVRSDRTEKLRIQCFGNFGVFGSQGLIKFKRSLSKEAFAYLVDRRGAGCTVGELCSILWEDKQSDRSLKSQCRVIMAALKKDLTDAGYGDVIIKEWNTWAVDPEKVNCDYYDYLKRDSDNIEAFRGEYLSQYSWAEMTAGVLYDLTKKDADT